MAPHPAKAVACGMFRPGQLTPNDASELNAAMRQIAALSRLSVASPLNITRAGGVASISINPTFFEWVILGEVTAVTSGDHTVKRLTWDGSAIADYDPLTEYENCRSATGSDLAVGTTVMVFPIPDVSGDYWIVPVWTFDEICTGVVDCILSKLCVVKSGSNVTDIKYTDSAGDCVVVPECVDTEGDCGPAPVVCTGCDGLAIPRVLTATTSCATCPTLDGQTVTLNYLGTTTGGTAWIWFGVLPSPCESEESGPSNCLSVSFSIQCGDSGELFGTAEVIGIPGTPTPTPDEVISAVGPEGQSCSNSITFDSDSNPILCSVTPLAFQSTTAYQFTEANTCCAVFPPDHDVTIDITE